jgi:hypothetical protein
MDFQVVVSVVVGLVTIGGLGFKLNAELSKIRSMIEVFIAKSEAKWNDLEKLERRVEHLEKKTLMKSTGSF